MAQIHNPLNKKDYKVSAGWDLVIKKNDGKNDLFLLGQSSLDVFEQIIRLALSTQKGSYKQSPSFGASPRNAQTYMTAEGLESIKSFIVENLRNSYINPNEYPVEVKVVPLARSLIAIQVVVFIAVPGNNRFLSINSIFNETTQELATVQTFGE